MDTESTPGPRGTPQIEHKHGLDEWSVMLPERSATSVVLGERPPDDVFRCQRVGCTEVIRLVRDESSQGGSTAGGSTG
jgi:hypothetical protein